MHPNAWSKGALDFADSDAANVHYQTLCLKCSEYGYPNPQSEVLYWVFMEAYAQASANFMFSEWPEHMWPDWMRSP